jgi:SAM-dependent methyltransferase
MDSAGWDRRYAEGKLLWGARPNRFLEQEVADLDGGRAIDLACGQGRNAVWLAGRGWAVTGVDFSAVALDQARGLAAEHGVAVDWVLADLLTYEPEPQAHDLVLIFYLQVGAAERRTMLRAAAEGVSPGGTFLMVGHHAQNIEHGYGGPQDPSRLYSAEDIVTDLVGTGLSVERAEMVRRPVETPEGERIALDALVRARRPAR